VLLLSVRLPLPLPLSLSLSLPLSLSLSQQLPSEEKKLSPGETPRLPPGLPHEWLQHARLQWLPKQPSVHRLLCELPGSHAPDPLLASCRQSGCSCHVQKG